MSTTVFVQHSYKKTIGVQSTSFRDQFVVVSSASEVITLLCSVFGRMSKCSIQQLGNLCG